MQVLYLEDDPLDAEALRRALVRLRPDVALELTPTPASAFALARARASATCLGFDVVIVDVNLPQMNGFEFIDAMTAEMGAARRPKVVVFTSSEHRLDLAEATRIQADAYVVKTADPTCFDHLVAALDRLDIGA